MDWRVSKMKNKIFAVLMFVLCVALFSGCQYVPPEQTGRLYIRVLIDGLDTLYIKNDTMWLVHHLYQHPGKWAGSDLPVYINDRNNNNDQSEEWYPRWEGNLSNTYKVKNQKSALPTSGSWDANNMKIKSFNSAFGTTKIVAYPSEANGYTLILDLDDVEPDGAHWYVLDIDWDD